MAGSPDVPRVTAPCLAALVTAGLVVVSLSACDVRRPDIELYTVAEGEATWFTDAPSKSETELVRVLELGRIEGPEYEEFGMVSDVGLGSDGSIYVVDARAKRVAAFAEGGTFRRWIGRTGEGPGEFLSPFKIAVFDSLIAVFDQQLVRVNVFDTSGAFVHSFRVRAPMIESFTGGPYNTVIATSAMTAHKLYQWDLSGRLVRSLVGRPVIDTLITGPYAPQAGEVCFLPSGPIVYANAWIYELVAFDPARDTVVWVSRHASDVIRPVTPPTPDVGPRTQGGVVLGLQCGEDWILLAYLDLANPGKLYYDFLDDKGAPLARITFERAAGQEFPGFAADLSNGRLATFRTRPYSQVFVYHIASRPR